VFKSFQKTKFFYQVKQKSCKFQINSFVYRLTGTNQEFTAQNEMGKPSRNLFFRFVRPNLIFISLFFIRNISICHLVYFKTDVCERFLFSEEVSFFCLRTSPLTFKYNLFPSISVLANMH
jgi:hypothetical protein